MTREDAQTIADALGSAIAKERAKTRADLEAAITAAKAAVLAECRAMIAEGRAAELERTVDRLLGSSSQPQRGSGSTAIVALPRRVG